MSDDVPQSGNPSRSASRRTFFFRLPNIILELELSAHALALYCAIRRTADEGSVCWRSTRTLARMCGMSTGSVCAAKKELISSFSLLNNKTLIQIEQRRNPRGGKPNHHIRIVDIWSENSAYYGSRANNEGQPMFAKSAYSDAASTSTGDFASAAGDGVSSAGEIKKTIEERTDKEWPPSLSPSSRETRREAPVELSEFWNFLCTTFGRTDNRGPRRSERKLMLHWLPVAPEEYRLIKWWMSLENRRYDPREGIGFQLRRRPRSVRSLLQDWGSVNDIARNYWKEYESRGHLH